DVNPQISGSNIVWQNLGTSSSTIFLSNAGGTPTPLSASTGIAVNPQVSGSNIVWQANTGTNLDLFYSNGSGTPIRLTENGVNDLNPRISGANVVWSSQASGSATSEIFLTNNARQDSFTFTVTDGVGGSTVGTFNFTIG
ncbi:MAG: hypothetical protein F6K28_57045, partial [Microcoleus sp. SIO2G3]|nr:hypothetical protein [Microcoleus sp. SIO2G3]